MHGGGASFVHQTGVEAAALTTVFHQLFLAAAAGFAASLICLLVMEERPLRSGVSQPQEPAAAG
jgi:hypothetical protein